MDINEFRANVGCYLASNENLLKYSKTQASRINKDGNCENRRLSIKTNVNNLFNTKDSKAFSNNDTGKTQRKEDGASLLKADDRTLATKLTVFSKNERRQSLVSLESRTLNHSNRKRIDRLTEYLNEGISKDESKTPNLILSKEALNSSFEIMDNLNENKNPERTYNKKANKAKCELNDSTQEKPIICCSETVKPKCECIILELWIRKNEIRLSEIGRA